MLGSGMTLRDVFRQQAQRGRRDIRPVAERIADDLEAGDSVEDALERERLYFPPLFLAMAVVGEQTGNLVEVFVALERYYQRQLTLRRQFVSQITLPVLQLVGAICVVAGLIFILGMLPAPEGPTKFVLDPIGLGTGPGGALRFLLLTFGTLGVVGATYVLVTMGLAQQATVDAFLLRIPAIGPCLRDFALMRFCIGLHMTMETALPITKAIRLSLRATGNHAFMALNTQIQDALRSGDDLTVAMKDTGVFPWEFLNIISVAEESGRLPEVMRQQSEYYEEEAARRLTLLTRMSSVLVWMMVAGIIIVAIIRIFGMYIGVIESFTP